jgi:mitochondrial distribution and morphology protein 34
MAFNFNWSPLMADTSRARDMLTTALNKSPKPPIIVDDIIVTELNMGSTPPELEILEVGDLAEDRFRGIFKMSYTGDAFLTLKTRVQANPLNTYLSAKPTFASPQPLAAASGLTIPLQITLSDIRLSGFVILVFSRQKGLTLVFRNDPLESLKVSSTFDSIPFVRDYLQKEIEGQLRVLFMEDLPAILHRLSLRLWSPEYQEMDDEKAADSSKDTTAPIDPLASPPQDAIDAFGNPLDESQISSLSLDPSETYASFSQKNLLRLAALTESHRTLSLFTPSMREAVFRAWAGAAERDHSGTNTPSLTLSSLSRIQSSFNNSVKSNASSIASGSTGNETTSSRPTLQSFGSTGLGGGRSRTHPSRKRKNRVVNLRRDQTDTDSASVSTEPSVDAPSIIISDTSVIPEEKEDIPSPPRSPTMGLRFHNRNGSLDVGEPSQILEQNSSESATPATPKLADTPKSSRSKSKAKISTPDLSEKPKTFTIPTSKPPSTPIRYPHPTRMLRSLSLDKIPFPQNASVTSNSRLPVSPPYAESALPGGILEQAWMMKMAAEIARKVHEEKDKEAKLERENAGNGNRQSRPHSNKAEGLWARSEDDEVEAPPAYVA